MKKTITIKEKVLVAILEDHLLSAYDDGNYNRPFQGFEKCKQEIIESSVNVDGKYEQGCQDAIELIKQLNERN